MWTAADPMMCAFGDHVARSLSPSPLVSSAIWHPRLCLYRVKHQRLMRLGGAQTILWIGDLVQTPLLEPRIQAYVLHHASIMLA